MLMAIMVLIHVPMQGLMTVEHQYTFLRFHWQVDERSAYSSFKSAVKVVGLFVFAPVVNNWLKIKNVNVMIFVIATTFMEYLMEAFATNSALFYTGNYKSLLINLPLL